MIREISVGQVIVTIGVITIVSFAVFLSVNSIGLTIQQSSNQVTVRGEVTQARIWDVQGCGIFSCSEIPNENLTVRLETNQTIGIKLGCNYYQTGDNISVIIGAGLPNKENFDTSKFLSNSQIIGNATKEIPNLSRTYSIVNSPC